MQHTADDSPTSEAQSLSKRLETTRYQQHVPRRDSLPRLGQPLPWLQQGRFAWIFAAACLLPAGAMDARERAAMVAICSLVPGQDCSGDPCDPSHPKQWRWAHCFNPTLFPDLASSVARCDFAKGLTGTLPSEMGGLALMRSLHLYDNSLSGTIPSEVGDLISLRTLDLHGNSLSGTIPSDVGDLTSLRTLDLHGNSLSGTLPSELRLLTSLDLCNLAGNDLSLPSSDAERATQAFLQQRRCSGIPPLGCTAFAGMVSSTTNPNECVPIPDNTQTCIGLLVAVLLIAVGVAAHRQGQVQGKG